MLNDFKTRLAGITAQLENIDIDKNPDSAETSEAFKPLIDLAGDKSFLTAKQEILNDPEIAVFAAKSCKMYQHWRTMREYQIAKGNFDLSQLDNTATYAVLESEKAKLFENSKVLFIGSGPLPKSVLAISMAADCTIVGLDKDQEAIELAQKLIDRLKLDSKISFVQGDAEQFSYEGFSHIFIANYAYDKSKILAQIKKTASSDTKIICRSARGLAFICYDRLPDSLLDQKEVTEVNGDHLMISFIFKPSAIKL